MTLFIRTVWFSDLAFSRFVLSFFRQQRHLQSVSFTTVSPCKNYPLIQVRCPGAISPALTLIVLRPLCSSFLQFTEMKDLSCFLSAFCVITRAQALARSFSHSNFPSSRTWCPPCFCCIVPLGSHDVTFLPHFSRRVLALISCRFSQECDHDCALLFPFRFCFILLCHFVLALLWCLICSVLFVWGSEQSKNTIICKYAKH